MEKTRSKYRLKYAKKNSMSHIWVTQNCGPLQGLGKGGDKDGTSTGVAWYWKPRGWNNCFFEKNAKRQNCTYTFSKRQQSAPNTSLARLTLSHPTYSSIIRVIRQTAYIGFFPQNHTLSIYFSISISCLAELHPGPVTGRTRHWSRCRAEWMSRCHGCAGCVYSSAQNKSKCHNVAALSDLFQRCFLSTRFFSNFPFARLFLEPPPQKKFEQCPPTEKCLNNGVPPRGSKERANKKIPFFFVKKNGLPYLQKDYWSNYRANHEAKKKIQITHPLPCY